MSETTTDTKGRIMITDTFGTCLLCGGYTDSLNACCDYLVRVNGIIVKAEIKLNSEPVDNEYDDEWLLNTEQRMMNENSIQ